MKNIGKEIDRILRKRQIKRKDFANMLNMTPVNISKILKKESIDALLLEKIASVLDITVLVFFDKDINKYPDEDEGKSPLEDGVSAYITKNGVRCGNCDNLEKLIGYQNKHIERLEKELEKQKE